MDFESRTSVDAVLDLIDPGRVRRLGSRESVPPRRPRRNGSWPRTSYLDVAVPSFDRAAMDGLRASVARRPSAPIPTARSPFTLIGRVRPGLGFGPDRRPWPGRRDRHRRPDAQPGRTPWSRSSRPSPTAGSFWSSSRPLPVRHVGRTGEDIADRGPSSFRLREGCSGPQDLGVLSSIGSPDRCRDRQTPVGDHPRHRRRIAQAGQGAAGWLPDRRRQFPDARGAGLCAMADEAPDASSTHWPTTAI